MTLSNTLPARLLTPVLDVLLPPRCLGCGAGVDGRGALCAGCWAGLSRLAPPWCRHCGRPLPESASADPLCGPCAAKPPSFDRARAAFAYDEGCRRMILRFKHGDRIEAAPGFGLWLARACPEMVAEAGIVLPVPLHRGRLWRRGYNQSALLARVLARASGRPLAVDLLLRDRPTASQQGLSAAARRRNVTAAAFRINPRRAAELRGRRALLIDDVFTTGATVAACARVLKRGGATAVDVLTLARVVRPLTPDD